MSLNGNFKNVFNQIFSLIIVTQPLYCFYNQKSTSFLFMWSCIFPILRHLSRILFLFFNSHFQLHRDNISLPTSNELLWVDELFIHCVYIQTTLDDCTTLELIRIQYTNSGFTKRNLTLGTDLTTFLGREINPPMHCCSEQMQYLLQKKYNGVRANVIKLPPPTLQFRSKVNQ